MTVMFKDIKIRRLEQPGPSESAAKVGVYFSPESRDYLDKASGTGLFATTKSKDTLWWSREEVDSVYSLTYLAEYRGVIKWLLHHHVPFDIVVRPDAAELSRYETRGLGDDLELLATRADQVIVVELTHPVLRVPVVKVIVPGRATDVEALG